MGYFTPVSKMYMTGNTFHMANCTSEFRYISDTHGWRFEPICFIVGPASAAVPVFLRADLTCAVYQPLIYLSKVHEESGPKAMCASGPRDYDDGNDEGDANSTFGFLGWFYHLDEGLGKEYLGWKFTLLLTFGLVAWGFSLYKFCFTFKRIVRACGGLFRPKRLTFPVHVLQGGHSDTGIAVDGSLPHPKTLQAKPVQATELLEPEIKAGPRSPKNSSAPYVLGFQPGYVEETISEETSSVSAGETIISSTVTRQEIGSVNLSLQQASTGTRALENTPVHPYPKIRNTETIQESSATSEQMISNVQPDYEEGASVTLPVKQVQWSEEHMSFDDRVSSKLAIGPKTVDRGHLKRDEGDGHLQRTAVGCQRTDGIMKLDGIMRLDGIHASDDGSPANIYLPELRELTDLDSQGRHAAEKSNEYATCAVNRLGHAEIEDDGTGGRRHIHELLQIPEETQLELPTGILEHPLNLDESSLWKGSDAEGLLASDAPRHPMVEECLDLETPNIVKYKYANDDYTDGSPEDGASISTNRRKSKRGKKDLQMAVGKPGTAERKRARGGKSDRRKENESEVSNTTNTDPSVLSTVHRRPVAEPYRAVEVSRNQGGAETTVYPRTPDEFHKELQDYIQKQKLDRFYPPSVAQDSPIRKLALKAAQRLVESKLMLSGAEVARSVNSFGVDGASNTPPLLTGRYYADICKTALYKTVLLIDDSGSMKDDNRYKILKGALERNAELNATIDEEGLSMRFLNYPRQKEHQIPWGLDNIQGALKMKAILDTNLWKGGTELGGMLLEKVLEPLVFEKARQNQLNKPIFISIITDGEVYCPCSLVYFDRNTKSP
ncbi:hypothetical protein BGX38DRAFT_1227389 [Terfezia claveryi]|nr:hypothetical protein BGX38DRAFT_1227389 [Terfezia claveryi]